MGHRTLIVDLDRLYGGVWKLVFALVVTIPALAGLAWLIRAIF